MPADRHITWENFRESFIKPGDPAAHPVEGTPHCEIFVESQGERVGLRIPTSDSSEIVELPYQHIHTVLVHSGGSLCVEVSCDVKSLYEPFYAMVVSVADLVQRHGYEPTAAIHESARKFFSLLAAHAILSEEKQVGLWCELWVLERLICFRGVESVQSWIGPLEEPHDFRLDNIEIEVKGTRSRKRTHIISREDQLLPSSDSSLYLLSLQLAPGAGDSVFSLSDRVQAIIELLDEVPGGLSTFKTLLSEVPYDFSHEHLYNDQYKLRTRPTLVPITDETPRITTEVLKNALGSDKSRRLSDIKFRLDVTDLGYEEASDEFQSVVRTK